MAKDPRSNLTRSRNPSKQTEGKWELLNAEEKHARYPNTFEIPSRRERETLKRGILVQLHFLVRVGRARRQVHRMPVRITKRVRGGYEGTLESEPDPLAHDVLIVGDTISFRPEHIATVYIPVTDPRHPAYRKNKLKG